MDWWYNYESIGSYYNVMKREILASLTDSELRSMITEKRRNIEFNEKLKWSSVDKCWSLILYYNVKIIAMLFWYRRHFRDKLSVASRDTFPSIIDIIWIPAKYNLMAIEDITKQYNQKKIDMLNAPLIKCIEVFDREIRNRSSEKKKNQVDLGELKAKIDIVEVVQSYVSLGRYKPGQLIKCPLPMHKDKTASCMLYQKNNTWHCHGCHQGWSQLDFIMLMTGCSLPDAIKKLSNF